MSAYDLAFEIDVPRGSISAAVALAGYSARLHPAGSQPFVVPRGSWVPAGVTFHGVLRVARRDVPPRSRQTVQMTGCTIRGCATTTDRFQLPGPDDPGPICHIGLGEVSAQARLLAGLPR